MGHLKFALETGLKSNLPGSVFDVLREVLGDSEDERLLGLLGPVYIFRNKFVAHFEIEAVSKAVAQDQLRKWVELLVTLHRVHSRDVIVLKYRDLVDKQYLEGLSASEVIEVHRLRTQLDEYGEDFYRPILDEVRRLVARRSEGLN